MSARTQRILFIDGYPPMPDRNSGGRRMTELLKLVLADGHDVSFLAQDLLDESPPYVEMLRGLGIHTAVATANGQVPPDIASQHYNTIIIAFYTVAESYLPVCRELFPEARIIIDTIDLHFLREQRHAAVVDDAKKAAKAEDTRRRELNIYEQADALWAITPVEQHVLRSETSVADVAIVPNIHDVSLPTVSFAARHGLVFVGNFWHPPNTEGMVWFCHDVLPLIRAHIPDITTTVVGANAKTEYFTPFESQGVRLAGWVPDMHDVFQRARVSIAPLLHGAGMKGKVGEALGMGLPVVTTSIGSEGMGLTDGINVLVGDDAESFAAHVVRAYTDADVWQSLSQQGYGFMRTNYTPAALRSVVRSAILPEKTTYIGVPDWREEFAVKGVVDAYVRRYSGAAGVSLVLGVVQFDANDAGSLLAQWLIELGHDLETIPDVELRSMRGADVMNLPADHVWVPMGARKPDHLSSVGAFFPAHAIVP